MKKRVKLKEARAMGTKEHMQLLEEVLVRESIEVLATTLRRVLPEQQVAELVRRLNGQQ